MKVGTNMFTVRKYSPKQRSFRLCKLLIESKGNPSVKAFLECGYTMDDFIRLSRISDEKLYAAAIEQARAWGI